MRDRRSIIHLLEMLVASLVVVAGFFFFFAMHHSATLQRSLARADVAEMIVSVSTATKSFSGPTTILATRASDGKHMWDYASAQHVTVRAALSVQGHVVYAKLNEEISALQVDDGRLRWRVSLPLPFPVSDYGSGLGNMIVDQGLVLAQAYDSDQGSATLFALRAKDGKVLWQYQTGSGDLFTVANGSVYTASPHGSLFNLVSLQETTGRVLWSQNFAPSSLAVQGNTVYAFSFISPFSKKFSGSASEGKAEMRFLALNAQNGKVRWFSRRKVPISSFDATRASLRIEKDRLLLFNGLHICAYATSDGHALWCMLHTVLATTLGTEGIPFVVVNNLLYAISSPSFPLDTPMQLEAVDSDTGAVKWAKVMPDSSILISILNDRVYILAAHDARLPTDTIYTFGLKDGQVLWQHGVPFDTLAVVMGN